MKRADPVELEFFRQLLVSIPEEMGVVLRKTSYSANIKERRDYSCALYDQRGQTVAMGDHMPVHLGAMPLSVRAVIEAFRLVEGDVAIVNDPFRGGTHLPDITAVAPVVVAGSRGAAFYVSSRAHHADVGGMSPGSMPLATEIYQEGIRIPPVRLMRGGRWDADLLALLLANVRTPEEREGDLRAQIAALERGARRLREAVSRYGLARVRRNVAALMDYSERMMRAALAGLPAGRYAFTDSLDDDGAGGAAVRVAVEIVLKDGEAVVDFTGSSPQAAGPVNANYAITLSAVLYAFRCLLAEDVPATEGLLRPIRLIAPEGTVVNARHPAAMAAGNVETSQRITDVLLGALAQASPERIPAASSGTMNNVSFGGVDPRSGERFAYYETIAGGMGASARHDGLCAVHTHMTNSWNTPVEAFEHLYPVRVRAYHVRRGSGGAGARRGGDGIRRELEFLAPAEVTILADRRTQGPYGLAGGEAGAPGRTTILRRGGQAGTLPGKVRFFVQPGDRLRVDTPGGGGHGADTMEARPEVI
jgi:N-methylhydantoinase B/oxoprolinase/acetone carboxylase alpha subunit